MLNPIIDRTTFEAWPESGDLCRVMRLQFALLLFVMALIPAISGAQTKQSKSAFTKATPEPAVPAILAAFDKYEVVAMPEAHGMKDVDDFILSLIRNPGFPEKVNDIEVECGNSLYQQMLDRYIAGEDVPFTEARKVWRNTTQPMCGESGFFEQFFPVVRAINQKLPPGKRLRVLAGDPPVDWDQVRSSQDFDKFLSADRDTSIASVMEKEVLSKHRKALMLFGTFHLFHGVPNSAVSIYEKDYPNVTFVISDIGTFDTDLPNLSSSPFATWQVPSLVRLNGTELGALDLTGFSSPPFGVDKDCKVFIGFPKELQKPMANLVDALLYLGPQDLRLNEQMPADIALDTNYMIEMQRRSALSGSVEGRDMTSKEFNLRTVNRAESPLIATPKTTDFKPFVQSCLDRKSRTSTP